MTTPNTTNTPNATFTTTTTRNFVTTTPTTVVTTTTVTTVTVTTTVTTIPTIPTIPTEPTTLQLLEEWKVHRDDSLFANELHKLENVNEDSEVYRLREFWRRGEFRHEELAFTVASLVRRGLL